MFGPWLHCSPAVWPWPRQLSSLRLHFFICKMGWEHLPLSVCVYVNSVLSQQHVSVSLPPQCICQGITNLDFSFPSFIPILTLVMGTLNTFSQVKEPEPFLWLMTNQGTFMLPRHWTERREPSTRWWLRRWTGTPTGPWSRRQNSSSRSRTLMTTLPSSYTRPIMPTCLRGPTWVRKGRGGRAHSTCRPGVSVGGQAGAYSPKSGSRIYAVSSMAK